MATEHDELPEPVLKEVQTFADVNTAWLREHLVAAKLASPAEGELRARAIYAAVAGAEIIARSRSDVKLFDELIESYRRMSLLPS